LKTWLILETRLLLEVLRYTWFVHVLLSLDYLRNVRRADDLIVIVYCPEAPYIPSFSFKSKIASVTILEHDYL